MKSNRTCEGCGKHLPWRTMVDGCEKSLGTRKFCVSCRPYKNDGREYKHKSDRRKKQLSLAVMRLCAKRKEELVKMAGGKCEHCGYDKCVKALSFHHKDPSTKKFPINARSVCRGWDVVVDEMKKCQLLCLNCHAEEESRIDKERVECDVDVRV